MFRNLIIAVAIAISTVVAAVPPAISIHSHSSITSAPGYFRIRTTIERNERNRAACLELQQVQNGSYYRKSCWEMQGTAHPRTDWQMLKDLPAGRYVMQATLFRNNEQVELSNVLNLHVTGFGYESEPAP